MGLLKSPKRFFYRSRGIFDLMGPKLLKHIIEELNSTLMGGVVSKIHQGDERNLILKIFTRGATHSLLISAHHQFPRVHLTEESFYNPPSPLRFCAYLRSRIANARIEGFGQPDHERIVHIHLKKGFDGEAEEFTLVAELTGKSSNIILLEKDGVVLDALKYFPEDSVRPVMPGITLEPLPPHPVEEEELIKEEGVSWNEFADRFYTERIKGEGFTLEKNRLKRAITEAEKKAKRKFDNLEGDRTKAERELEYYRTGEILTSNFHLLKKGMREVEAIDYTATPPANVVIKLDEKLSPKENVEKFFKRARKAKTALALLKERMPEVEEELKYIDSLKYEWEAAKTTEDIEALKDELMDAGYLKTEGEKAGRIKEEAGPSEPIRKMTSSDGFEILCGKSGKGNDLIVRKYAKDEDIWFHAYQVPGSHVLIKAAGKPEKITDKTIEEAAALAAWHSKARTSGKVEVIYTEAKNVKKPRGAKPGMVTVKEFKSILVRPKDMS